MKDNNTIKIPSFWCAPASADSKVSDSFKLSNSSIAVHSTLRKELCVREEDRLYLIPFGSDYKITVTVCANRMQVRTHAYGLHPVYYFHEQGKFYCSSSLKVLLNLVPHFNPAVNINSLLHLYSFGFEPADESMICGIHKLPAGSLLSFEDGQVKIERYYQVEDMFQPENYHVNEESYIKQIDTLFEQGLKLQHNEKLNGISLSGGVDSGYTAVKLKQINANFQAYTMLYGSTYAETDRIAVLEKELNIKVKRLQLTERDIIKNFENVNSVVSSPCGFNNATMNILFEKAAADNVEVLFDGDGADRLFLGMNRYLQYQKVLNLYRLSYTWKTHKILPEIMRFIPHKEVTKVQYHFRNWNNGIVPYFERVHDSSYTYNPEFEQELFGLSVRPYWEMFCTSNDSSIMWNDPFKFLGYFSLMKCPEMFFHQPSELQVKLGMASAPAFWYDKLVELAVNIPSSLKLKNKTTKYILRKAASKQIIPEYWKLPKIGLQSAFNFVRASGEGSNWISEVHNNIPGSKWFGDLQDKIPYKIQDLNRLIPFYIWWERLHAN